MTYERDAIARMAGYAPGEQPARPVVAKLNTNENPYPPCPAVMDALRGIGGDALRRYPSAMADGFRAEAARLHGLTADHIIATNGGDELLRLAITTFVEPGGPVGIAEPGYSLYPVLAALHDSPLIRVPLAADWSLPDGCRPALERRRRPARHAGQPARAVRTADAGRRDRRDRAGVPAACCCWTRPMSTSSIQHSATTRCRWSATCRTSCCCAP